MRFNHISALIFLSPAALGAQGSTLITGTVIGSIDRRPLPYGTVSLEGVTARKLTSPEGRFSFKVDSAGDYNLRIRQLGFAPLDTIVRFEGSPLQLTLVLRPVAFRLADVRTIGKTPCSRAVSRDAFASGILEEVKKNAEKELVLRNQYAFFYTLAVGRATQREGDRHRPITRDTVVLTSVSSDRYRVGGLVRPRAFGDAGGREMRIPQLTDLADSAFLHEHCFSYGGIEKLRNGAAFRLDFTPANRVRTPDVEGSISIDTLDYTVKQAVFRMTSPELLTPPIVGLEVRTTYREILPGLPVFDVIRSTQPLSTQNPFGLLQVAVEEQRLIRLQFVRDTPSGVSDFAMPLLRTDKDR